MVSRCDQASNLDHQLLRSAAKVQNEIDELVSELSTHMKCSDRDGLRRALRNCHEAGLPRLSCMCEAEIVLHGLDNLLGQLQGAIASRRISLLEKSIAECRARGMPAKYFQEALVTKQQVQRLHDKLESACKSRDVDILAATVKDGEIQGFFLKLKASLLRHV